MSAETEGGTPGGAPEPLPGTRDARSGAWLDDIRRSGPAAPAAQTASIPWWRGGPVQAALRLARMSQFGKLRR